MELDLNSTSYATLGERIENLHERLRVVAPEVERMAVALYDADADLLKTFINSTVSGTVLRTYQYRLGDSASLSDLARSHGLRVLTDVQDRLQPTTEHSTYVLSEGYESSLTVPMTNQGDFLGFVFFDSRSRGTFTPELQRELVLYAHVITMAIANELMAVRTIIGTVMVARDLTRLRDSETGSHLERMARYSRLIARALAGPQGLSDEFVEHVFLYAPLHDIGKIGIPDRILLKPGPLDAEEWEVMRRHTTRGRQMIENITRDMRIDNLPDDSLARNIAEYHHEKMDGSGYPAGLVGDAIPLEARIVAVADVYDALTSHRPYKQPWSVSEAFAELQAMAETGKLDPACVAALAAQRDEAEQVRVDHPDEPLR